MNNDKTTQPREQALIELGDAYKLADALYAAGYTDRKHENDYDPRRSVEWQTVVNTLALLAAPEAPASEQQDHVSELPMHHDPALVAAYEQGFEAALLDRATAPSRNAAPLDEPTLWAIYGALKTSGLTTLAHKVSAALTQQSAAQAPRTMTSASSRVTLWYTTDDDGKPFRATCYSVEAQQWRDKGREVFELLSAPAPESAAFAIPEARNIVKIDRTSDSSLWIGFTSCRAASSFENSLRAAMSAATEQGEKP